MNPQEYIEDRQRSVIIYKYPSRELVDEYESIAKAAKFLFNNPQRSEKLRSILNKKNYSTYSPKLDCRVTVVYKD